MAIKFRCEHCGKQVSAPEEAGGKRGKCPYCRQRCYVPLPKDQVEEIPLAPIDPDEERRRKQLAAELAKAQSRLLDDKEAPLETSEPLESTEAALPFNEDTAADQLSVEDLVQQYMIHMVRGELTAAEELAKNIQSRGPSALETIDNIAMGQIVHPELISVPPNVISGFFRQLRKQISQ